jgi:hypothetical protein
LAEHAHVTIGDVAAVFSQVHGDAVGTAKLCFMKRTGNIRLAPGVHVAVLGRAAISRLAERGDVVDVDGEEGHGEDRA